MIKSNKTGVPVVLGDAPGDVMSWRQKFSCATTGFGFTLGKFTTKFTTGFTRMSVRRRRMDFSGTTRRSEKVGLCQRLTLHIASW